MLEKFSEIDLLNLSLTSLKGDPITLQEKIALIDYYEKRLGQVKRKAETDRQRALKRAYKDLTGNLSRTVVDILTEDWQKTEELMAKLDDKSITPGMLHGCLKQLIKFDIVEKSKSGVSEKGHKCMLYRLKK